MTIDLSTRHDLVSHLVELPATAEDWQRYRLTEDQVVAFLAAITCPVLVIRARDGYPFDESYLGTRTEAVRDLSIVEVDGGHHVHLDHPERVIEAAKTVDAGSSSIGSAPDIDSARSPCERSDTDQARRPPIWTSSR